MKLVEDVGFVDEGDDGVVFSMASPGAGGIKVSAPDGVESGNEDALALDGEIGAIVLEVVDARVFQVAEKMARRAVPLACSQKFEPSVMRVPGVSRVYDSHEKKKTYPRTDRQKTSRCP